MATMQTSLGTVSYTDEGSGPPVLLLHAALHDRTDFAPVTEALAKGRRVLALDWPGHGESPLPATPLRAVQFGDLLIEFADGLDLTNAVVVGNSVGGYAACRLALERPERVAGVVLVNTGGFTPHSVFTRFFCAAMGGPAVVKAVFPAFVRAYMRAKNPTDKAVVDRVMARAKTDDGARTAAALWKSFTDPGHDLRTRAAQVTRAGAHHMGRKGSHCSTALGESDTGRHCRVQIRVAADGSCRLLIRTGGMAGNGPAVRRRRARYPC